jgi:hypothetical protein
MKVGDRVKFKSSDKGYTIAEIMCIRRDEKKVYYDILLLQKNRLIAGLGKEMLESIEQKEESGNDKFPRANNI